jgi:hypothetical protein
MHGSFQHPAWGVISSLRMMGVFEGEPFLDHLCYDGLVSIYVFWDRFLCGMVFNWKEGHDEEIEV